MTPKLFVSMLRTFVSTDEFNDYTKAMNTSGDLTPFKELEASISHLLGLYDSMSKYDKMEILIEVLESPSPMDRISAIDAEIAIIERENHTALIKLKVWTYKLVMITILLVTSFLLVSAAMSSTNTKDLGELLEVLLDIASVVSGK